MAAIRSNFLRTVLALDAAACGAMGAGFAFAATGLEGPLGLSQGLMQPVGLFLVGYATLLVWLATRPALPRAVVWSLVGFNLLWAVESIGVLALGWAQPTTIGMGFVVAQAVAALIVAELQYLCVRRGRAVAA